MTERPAIPGIMAQRFPILLIDRILEADAARVSAIKNITYNEPCYEHMTAETRAEAFAYPCSLIIESFSQSVGVLLRRAWPQASGSGHVIMFGSIGRFRFLGEAFPGDVLEHDARIDRLTEDTAILCGEVRRGGAVLATVERIIAVIRPITPETRTAQAMAGAA